jgi:predicted RNase H-like HicB family nuclease
MQNDRMNIDYTVQIWREGEQFVAHAMPLDVMSAGATPEDARHALDEAVGLFLKTASDMGTFEQVLEEVGYVFQGDSWEGPAWVGVEHHTLSVVA